MQSSRKCVNDDEFETAAARGILHLCIMKKCLSIRARTYKCGQHPEMNYALLLHYVKVTGCSWKTMKEAEKLFLK